MVPRPAREAATEVDLRDVKVSGAPQAKDRTGPSFGDRCAGLCGVCLIVCLTGATWHAGWLRVAGDPFESLDRGRNFP